MVKNRIDRKENVHVMFNKARCNTSPCYLSCLPWVRLDHECETRLSLYACIGKRICTVTETFIQCTFSHS